MHLIIGIDYYQLLNIIKDLAAINGIDLSLLEIKQKQPANVELPFDTALLQSLFDLDTLTNSDTVITWLTRTNQIINGLNSLYVVDIFGCLDYQLRDKKK